MKINALFYAAAASFLLTSNTTKAGIDTLTGGIPVWHVEYLSQSNGILPWNNEDPLSELLFNQRTKELIKQLLPEQPPAPLDLKLAYEKEHLDYKDLNTEQEEEEQDPINKYLEEQRKKEEDATSNHLKAPFEQDDDDNTLQHPEEHNVSVNLETVTLDLFIPNKPVNDNDIPIMMLADNPPSENKDKKSDGDQSDGEESEDESAGTEATSQPTTDSNVRAVVPLTVEQENISEEELFADSPPPGFLANAYGWLPGIVTMVVSGAGTYATSTVTQSRFIQGLVFVTLFTASYIYQKFEELSHRPEWFIDKNGVLREAIISTGHEAVYRRSASSESSDTSTPAGRAMQGIDLTKLFAEFCQKLKIREDQYSTALAAFYLGAMTAWSGSESLRLEDTDRPDPELMRKYILRAAIEVLRQQRRLETEVTEVEDPTTVELHPDQVTGTEVTQRDRKSKKQTIILTTTGTIQEFVQRMKQLASGFYTLSNQTAVLKVDRSTEGQTYTVFYLMIKKEFYFTNEAHLARYLTAFHQQVIASPIPFSELFRSLFGNTMMIGDYDEAFGFMGFDINFPPTKEEFKKRYRKLVKEKHPDKDRDNPEAHKNFQKLQESKLKIEEYLSDLESSNS